MQEWTFLRNWFTLSPKSPDALEEAPGDLAVVSGALLLPPEQHFSGHREKLGVPLGSLRPCCLRSGLLWVGRSQYNLCLSLWATFSACLSPRVHVAGKKKDLWCLLGYQQPFPFLW